MLTTYLTKAIGKVYAEQPWYGKGMLESLERINEADWHRPVGHRTVAGLVAHLIAWRNFVIARLDGRTDFGIEMNTATDWPDSSGLSKETMLQQLADTQLALVSTLGSLTDEDLKVKVPKTYAFDRGDLALGVMQHDIYHLGQINLMMSMLENK